MLLRVCLLADYGLCVIVGVTLNHKLWSINLLYIAVTVVSSADCHELGC
jgi:hypothetical protein